MKNANMADATANFLRGGNLPWAHDEGPISYTELSPHGDGMCAPKMARSMSSPRSHAKKTKLNKRCASADDQRKTRTDPNLGVVGGALSQLDSSTLSNGCHQRLPTCDSDSDELRLVVNGHSACTSNNSQSVKPSCNEDGQQRNNFYAQLMGEHPTAREIRESDNRYIATPAKERDEDTNDGKKAVANHHTFSTTTTVIELCPNSGPKRGSFYSDLMGNDVVGQSDKKNIHNIHSNATKDLKNSSRELNDCSDFHKDTVMNGDIQVSKQEVLHHQTVSPRQRNPPSPFVASSQQKRPSPPLASQHREGVHLRGIPNEENDVLRNLLSTNGDSHTAEDFVYAEAESSGEGEGNVYLARNLSVIMEEAEDSIPDESSNSQLLPDKPNKTIKYTQTSGASSSRLSDVTIEVDPAAASTSKVITLTLPQDHDPKDVPSGFMVVPMFHLRTKLTRKQTIQVAGLMAVGFIFVLAILAWVFSPVILKI